MTELSSLQRFAQLANLFPELGDFVFDALVLLRVATIVLQLHRVQRKVVEVFLLVRLSASFAESVRLSMGRGEAIAS